MSKLVLIYRNTVRWWLICLLLYIPFVTRIHNFVKHWSSELSVYINRIDELTIVFLFPFAMVELLLNYRKQKELSYIYFMVFIPLVILSFLGLVSGLKNGNNILITALGTFAYVKYFLFIFIYTAYFRDFVVFMKVFRVILIVAIIIGIVAFIQEANAILSAYLIKADSNVESGGLFSILNPHSIRRGVWRVGVYRASSLLSHFNLLGLYSLLILSVYLHTAKKINAIVFFSLLSGVISSVSRTAYMGFLLLAGEQVFRGRKWFIWLLVPVLIILLFMGTNWDSLGDIAKMDEVSDTAIYTDRVSYRVFSAGKAIEVWKDYPVWGAGPGMFGGAIAYKYHSPLYEEYNFEMIFNWFRSLDQLWPQVLAEIGVLGTGALIGVFISLLAALYLKKQQTDDAKLNSFINGIITFTVIFQIYTFSGNLNLVSVLLPYCAFTGIALGCGETENESKHEPESL